MAVLSDFKDKQAIAYKITSNSIKSGQYSHAYLIDNNNADEGKSFALAFAKLLLCPDNKKDNRDCSNCDKCQVIDSGNSLEIKIIEADGLWIKKDQIIDLKLEFSRKAVIGQKKIYIINGIEKLNTSSANSVLRFLEEPAENIVAILITNNMNLVLETIISRCLLLPLKSNKDNFSVDKHLNMFLTPKIISREIDIHDIILKIINFVIYLGNYNLLTLAHLPKLLGEIYEDRDYAEIFFESMILLYKDCLDFKILGKLSYFGEYQEKVKIMAANFSVNDLCNKICIVVKAKEYLKINANICLLIDNMVMELSEGGNNG